MSSVAIGTLGVGIGFALIAMRMHIGLALTLVSYFGIAILLNVKAANGIITAVPFQFVGDWNLTAIPTFLLMGFIASESGLTSGLFRAARILLAWLPGGLAVASVGASAMFAAASGSSVATAAAMARIATPEMLRYGYDRSLSAGVIAASGTLGSLIPPSILLILYGYFAEVSVGKLFLAGVLPGIMSALVYIAMIIVRVSIRPQLAPRYEEKISIRDVASAVADVWPLPVLVAGVFSGIVWGFFTPTEAGAIGSVLAAVVALIRGQLTWTVLNNAIARTLRSTSSIFLVVIGTVLLTRFIALSGMPASLTSAIGSITHDPLVLILIIALIYIFLGMFVDSIGLMLLTLPILLPIADSVGADLIWFGIIIVKLLEIGLITPPIGLNIFVIRGALGDLISMSEIYRGVLWFIAMDILALAIIVFWPQLTLYLPSLI
ncbi:MAG: TRAP transporter large permease subunit [Silicimonas sp.]|jgi:C4-dicarboxylate transporter DctM subunit|uniref:TRAP transporter large permease n=1 Tax=Roseitalea porphyridii TaxID=1852022 RepID=UPI0032EB4011